MCACKELAQVRFIQLVGAFGNKDLIRRDASPYILFSFLIFELHNSHLMSLELIERCQANHHFVLGVYL